MSYYDDALVRIKNFHSNLADGEYKYCVALCCEAADRLLKEKLEALYPESILLEGHEFLEMYSVIKNKYHGKTDLTRCLRMLRKYFNDSRYSGKNSMVNPNVYTKKFAEEMFASLMMVKDYIDDECSDGMQGLADRFNRKKNEHTND